MAPGFTTTQFNVRGWDGIRGGDAACHGIISFKKDTGEEVERTVQSIYLEFTIRRVKLKMDYKTKVITVAGSGEKLDCAVGQSDIKSAPKFAGCSGVGETFLWPRLNKQYCPLHFICSIKGILMGRTFTAKQHMVAFDVTNQRADANTCDGVWQRTDVRNIYVSNEPGAGSHLQAIASGEPDPFLSLLLFKQYLAETGTRASYERHVDHPVKSVALPWSDRPRPDMGDYYSDDLHNP